MSLTATAVLLPVLAVSLWAGEWAHHCLEASRIRGMVYGLLLLAGLTNAL